MRQDTLTAIVVAAALATVCGCGPSQDSSLGLVTGTVKLDGAPVEGVVVMFEPVDARLSTGATDASGQYELWYTSNVKGAAIGEHVVRIEKSENPEQEELGGKLVVIPDRYNVNSTLAAEVKAGENTFDFDLVTKR